jgi:hypothetical protein
VFSTPRLLLALPRVLPVPTGTSTRSADTRAAGDSGQDYLTFSQDEQSFVFALCDWVSQSFYGDIAARLLGDGLLAWLARIEPSDPNAEVLTASLDAYLKDLTTGAMNTVQQQPLPDHMPPKLREVLEQKRQQSSESTLVCGRIDLPSKQLSQGRAVFAWMGGFCLRIWGPAGERAAELGDTSKTEEYGTPHCQDQFWAKLR